MKNPTNNPQPRDYRPDVLRAMGYQQNFTNGPLSWGREYWTREGVRFGVNLSDWYPDKWLDDVRIVEERICAPKEEGGLGLGADYAFQLNIVVIEPHKDRVHH